MAFFHLIVNANELTIVNHFQSHDTIYPKNSKFMINSLY